VCAIVAGFLPMARIELSPRPTPRLNRPSLISSSAAHMLALTDQSRTFGLVTSGPK
jgi:hypothetical protein